MDAGTQKIALIFLGLLGLACVIGALVLANDGKDLPEVIVAVAGACVGAIAGIVAPKAI